MRACWPTLLALLASGCAAQPRAPGWTCMQQVMDTLELGELGQPGRHCVASAAIARRCGATSALLAGMAKETSDLFGPGDASAEDLKANRAGRDCARQPASADFRDCCRRAGYR